MNLNELVRDYARKNNMYHSLVWNLVYKEASYRLSKNFKLLADNNGQAKIDYIEQNGYLPEILSIAMEILKK